MLCYDFDDPIITYSRDKFFRMIDYAEKIIIASPFLAEDFATKQKNHKIIYSPVDTDKITTVTEPHRTFTIGWIGSPYTLVHVEAMLDVFKNLAQQINYKLLVVGAQLKVDGVDVESVNWSEKIEIEALKRIDVGIMPLSNHSWSPKKEVTSYSFIWQRVSQL